MNDAGLIKNIRQFLVASKDFSTQLSGISTAIPPETLHPYVTLEWSSTQQNRDRTCVNFALKIWSAYQGFKEINTLGGFLKKILEAPVLAIPLEPHQESIQLKRIEEPSRSTPRVCTACASPM